MPLANWLKNNFDLFLKIPQPGGRKLDEREMKASDMIPYLSHYNEQTIITRDDALVQVIKVDGLPFESFTAEQIKQFERRRNALFRAIASPDLGVYVHLIRKRTQEYSDGEGESWFSRQFNEAWKKHIQDEPFYKNELYISVVRTRFRQGAPGLLDRMFSVFSNQESNELLERFDEQFKHINEVSNLICQGLSSYDARKLEIRRIQLDPSTSYGRSEVEFLLRKHRLDVTETLKDASPNQQYSGYDVAAMIGAETCEITEFLSYLLNLQSDPVSVSDLPISRSISNSWIDCNTVSNVMAIENSHETRACAVMSMAEWPNSTSSRMLDEFLRQPVEFIVTQSFFFTDRITAEYDLRQERRRIDVNDSDGSSSLDLDEITKGLEELKRGQAVNGLHHLSILVHVPVPGKGQDSSHSKQTALEHLDKACALLKRCFVNLGVKPVREWFAMETFYWSQLPGQSQHLIGRRGKIKSSNFAGFASLHNYASGRLNGNLWGPAIMSFPTESGTPYHFNFHRELEGMVAGHTAFSADTGAGKTTLLSALIAMSDKAKPRVFWFDNRKGARVFMAAMGGTHTTLSAQGSTGWNPFQLPDTPENRAYLVELLTLMKSCYGENVGTDDIERFKEAVRENYSLPFEDRRLRNIAWCFGQDSLAKTMRIWHGANGYEGANAGVFDNASDSLNLGLCRYHCFEMQQLIKDGEARAELPVMLSYPFHRIEQATDGEPFILVLEEGQNLVKHDYWRKKIDSYIMQIRRKNGLMIFVTPDPKYLYCETDSIQKQSATKIFLPNAEARSRDYIDELGLTQSEFEFIRDTPPEQRTFLIRRGNESIKAKFDLTPLAQFIPVLSSNDKSVALMEEVIDEIGDSDPEAWVPEFMHRASAKNTHNLTPSQKPSGVSYEN